MGKKVGTRPHSWSYHSYASPGPPGRPTRPSNPVLGPIFGPAAPVPPSPYLRGLSDDGHFSLLLRRSAASYPEQFGGWHVEHGSGDVQGPHSLSLGPIAAAVVAAVDLGRCGPAVMVAKCLLRSPARAHFPRSTASKRPHRWASNFSSCLRPCDWAALLES